MTDINESLADPDLGYFEMLNGNSLELFKRVDNRLSVTIRAPFHSHEFMHDILIKREAIRLRDKLIEMYPIKE